MKTRIFIVFFCLVVFLLVPLKANAIENPLSVTNNKIGIHILFTSELDEAARLVNSNGGQWGYVTIPIQAGDKNIEKWQEFMDQARLKHVIPIIRLATEGDYFNTEVWRKPKDEDIVDFSNFLNSLSWPTKNRYIVVFNETNRANEWGGFANPKEYANILSYTATVFKSKSSDFFIISGGFDNAAATTGSTINEFDFIRQMNEAVPGIFNKIDGLSSHSYPNPGFSKSPLILDRISIATFRYEKELIKNIGGKDLPVFITETGWSEDAVPQSKIFDYYKKAFESAWSDSDIVAVTPFLLRAGSPPFSSFSFIDSNGNPKEQYKSLENLSKEKGKPMLPPVILGQKTKNDKDLPVKDFSLSKKTDLKSISMPNSLKSVFRWLLKI